MQIEELAASMGHAADFGDSHPIVLWDAKARRLAGLGLMERAVRAVIAEAAEEDRPSEITVSGGPWFDRARFR